MSIERISPIARHVAAGRAMQLLRVLVIAPLIAGAQVAGAQVAGTQVAGAQAGSGVDPRFLPWLGCWRVSTMTLEASQPTRTCVVPSARVSGSVDLLVYADDSLLSRQAIPRPGTVMDRSIDECRGAEQATWTSDETRLILRAELSCGRGVRRVETGMMSLLPTGEWLQLQHLAVGANTATTATRFAYDDDGRAVGGALGGALGELRSTHTLRLAVGAPIAPSQLIELTRLAPVELVEAWITESAPRYDLDGRALASLADRGLPPRVIDLLVASAHPERFSIRPDDALRSDGRANGRPTDDFAMSRDRGVGRSRAARCAAYDDFCYGPAGMGAWGLGWRFGSGPWDPWDAWGDPWGYRYGVGYSRLGYGSITYPYGYGGYGWSGTYWGQRPIIIVNRPTNRDGEVDGSPTRGRAVRGGGYTRAEPSSGSSGSPRSGGTSSGGSTGTSSSGGTSSGGASTGRSAKPRPPGGS